MKIILLLYILKVQLNNGLNTHWNNGGWTSKSTAKDIEFIDTLLIILKQNYH